MFYNNKNPTVQWCALLLLLIFTTLVYVQMCIASLYDNYQVGIETVKLLLTPFWLIALMFGLLLCFPQRGHILRLATWFYRGALAVVAILFAVMVMIDQLPSPSVWSHPDTRNLLETLLISVTNPDFSGRSLGVLVGSVILLVPLAIMVEWRIRRAKRKA